MAERVLIIMNTIDAGGAETFVMKVFRCIHNEVTFDFLINKTDSNFYLKEINALGGQVFYGVSKSKNLFKSMKYTYKTVKDGRYEKVFCIAVHPMGFLDLMAARYGGAALCLTRSTNSSAGGKTSKILAKFCRPFMRLLTDIMLAPSKEAGEWLFGRKAVEKEKVKIIYNGIQTELYEFDQGKREKKRTELGLKENDFVVGHVGRFNKQKNHNKLIDIFNDVQRKNKNAKLVLVGDGELREAIVNKVDSLGLREKVLFLGIRNDVPDLLMAMDVFVFPSLYEGMPNAVIEAQATGLPCVISDSISRDVKITDFLVQIGLEKDTNTWVKPIFYIKNCNRNVLVEEIVDKGYSIKEISEYLKGFLKIKQHQE